MKSNQVEPDQADMPEPKKPDPSVQAERGWRERRAERRYERDVRDIVRVYLAGGKINHVAPYRTYARKVYEEAMRRLDGRGDA